MLTGHHSRTLNHLVRAGLAASFLAAPSVAGAKVKKAGLHVKPIPPKMKSFNGRDLAPIPGSAATIKVYEQDGHYAGISDLLGTTREFWKVEGVCPLGQTMVRSWVTANGSKATVYDIADLGKAGVLVRGFAPRSVAVEQKLGSLDIGVDPVAACNSELAARAEQSGKSREDVLRYGFVLKVNDAITASARAQCTTLWAATPGQLLLKLAKKKPKMNTLKASAKAPAYIVCKPAARHGKTPPAGPKPRVMPVKVKMNPVTTLFGGKQTTDIYYHKCPVQVRLSAQVLAPRSMTVRYRYFGSGWTGPVKEKQLKKGTQTLPVYNVMLGKPKAPGLKLKSGKAGPDHTGWAAVEILQSGKNIVSKKEPYRIYCHDKAKPAPKGKKPAKVSIGKIGG